MSNQTPQNYEPKDLRTLPILALISAFVFPPVGAIMGHLALGQLKRARIFDSQRSVAKAAVILGWIFTALLVVFLPVVYFFIVFVMSGAYPLFK